MIKNVERAIRILNASAHLIEIETRYSLDKDATGHERAKRELQKAFVDYLAYHIWPSARLKAFRDQPYNRGPQTS